MNQSELKDTESGMKNTLEAMNQQQTRRHRRTDQPSVKHGSGKQHKLNSNKKKN